MSKPIIAKPGLYAVFYEILKQIAKEYGYNLLVNGSMNRDLDLVCVPWVDQPSDELKMIQDFHNYLTGQKYESKENYLFSVLPGGRNSYVINLNRGNKSGEWSRFEDREFYIDISVTPLVVKK